jgi:hypothetical protein
MEHHRWTARRPLSMPMSRMFIGISRLSSRTRPKGYANRYCGDTCNAKMAGNTHIHKPCWWKLWEGRDIILGTKYNWLHPQRNRIVGYCGKILDKTPNAYEFEPHLYEGCWDLQIYSSKYCADSLLTTTGEVRKVIATSKGRVLTGGRRT